MRFFICFTAFCVENLIMTQKTQIISKILLLSILSLNLSCANHSDDPKPAPPTITDSKPSVDQDALAPIQKTNKLFKKLGETDKFEWVPSGYQQGFVYDIYYYIPSSIKNTKNSPALVFMHGGGQSTLTREGANRAVNLYIKDVIAASEKYKFIAVLPSSNGLNWGGHTERLMVELSKLMRANLNFDTNRLGLSGHSMGGMGITRTFTQMVNDFSFVNSISSAMDDKLQDVNRLNKMYNMKYSHQLGTQDEFDIFITRTKILEANVKKMEQDYGKPSLFEMEWFDDGHVYGAAQTKKLESLFKGQRNIFQNELYGLISFNNVMITENNIKFTVFGSKRYLWVENIPAGVADGFNFQAKAKNNRIDFSFDKDAYGVDIYPKSKKFKLYLSAKLFDLSKEISIYDGGYFVAKYKPVLASARKPGLMDKDDANTAYDDIFEFSFN